MTPIYSSTTDICHQTTSLLALTLATACLMHSLRWASFWFFLQTIVLIYRHTKVVKSELRVDHAIGESWDSSNDEFLLWRCSIYLKIKTVEIIHFFELEKIALRNIQENIAIAISFSEDSNHLFFGQATPNVDFSWTFSVVKHFIHTLNTTIRVKLGFIEQITWYNFFLFNCTLYIIKSCSFFVSVGLKFK